MAFSDSETYTNAQLIDHARKAIATIMLAGQSYTMPGGRTVTNADLGELRDMVDWLESQAATEADTGGGIALVQYGERV